MKFTLSWLKTHLDTTASLTEITDTLTAIGLELEGVEDRGAALASFRIAHVVEAAQHPNADRLHACKVDVGDGTLISVVCGAPNAHTGMKAVFAPSGSFIPGAGITSMTIDTSGNLITADYSNNKIEEIAPPYTSYTTIISGVLSNAAAVVIGP